MNLKASIVIASYNRRADLMECLNALPPAMLQACAAEVIVVDDGSTDGTVEMIPADYGHVRFLRNEKNMGAAATRNNGSSAAAGDLIIYLDSDAVPEAGWLEEMIAHDDGGTVLLGCIKDYEGDRIQSGPRRATFLGKSLRCKPEHADTGASCNLAIPRACFERTGGFDEEIPYYFEDSDLCIRAKNAGFRARYLENAVVRHKGTEFKKGAAVWMQEHNSTYAMLKAYRGRPLRSIAFTLLNGAWALARSLKLALTLNLADSRRILSGWWAAYRRFYLGRSDFRAF